jgi:hypothetical protein
MPIASIEADRLEPDGARGRPDQNAPLIDVDRLERRYRLVYPLKIFLENARQVVVASAAVLVVGAVVYFLQYAVSSTNEKAPIEIQVFLVTALSSLVVVGYIALWGLTVRNFWKLGSLLTLVLALVLGWSLYEAGMDVASPATEVTTRLMAAAPMSAVLLLAAIALTAAYYVHVIWALLEAAFGVALVAPSDRVIMRDRPPREVSRPGFFSRFWAFPPLFKFARTSLWRYAAIIMLSLASALLFSVAALLPLIMKGPIEDIPDLVEKCPTELNCLLPKVATLLDFFFFPFAGLLVCLVVGWLAQRLLRRLLRFSLETLQEIDPRPPVLFLRAFRDDQVPLRAPKIALFGRLLEIGRRSNSLDQLLLEEATPSGPVVGLGSPTDKRPPYGAARGYFTGETWQEAVANLAASSVFIVICIDDTAGVWWEVEQLVHRHLDKTLFLIHPRYTGEAENRLILARIAQHLRAGQEAGMLLAAGQTERGSEARRVIGFFRNQGGSLCILQSSTFSRFAYLMALRRFIRQRLPGVCE